VKRRDLVYLIFSTLCLFLPAPYRDIGGALIIYARWADFAHRVTSKETDAPSIRRGSVSKGIERLLQSARAVAVAVVRCLEDGDPRIQVVPA